MVAVVWAVSFQDRLFPLIGVILEVCIVDMSSSYVGWFFYQLPELLVLKTLAHSVVSISHVA